MYYLFPFITNYSTNIVKVWMSESIFTKLYNQPLACHNPSMRCFLLQELVVLLIQANSVFPPELLWLVHWTPLQAARLQLRAVLIKRTGWGRTESRINVRKMIHVEHILRVYKGQFIHLRQVCAVGPALPSPSRIPIAIHWRRPWPLKLQLQWHRVQDLWLDS